MGKLMENGESFLQMNQIDSSGMSCDLMHSQFQIEGSLYRLYSPTSVGTPITIMPNDKQKNFKF